MPDQYVGASEAAEILGVEVQRISRYSRHDRMPETIAELAATPVWLTKDIEYLRDHGFAPEEPPPSLKLVGNSEAATMLGVHKSQISRWVRDGFFPAPLVRLKAGPVWTADQVRRFGEKHL